MKTVFRKFFPFFFVFCILFTSSCGDQTEQKYNAGIEAMKNEEWATAIEYFTDISYNDSSDLLQKCLKEKGMNEKADYDFLKTMSEAVMKRYETSLKTDNIEKCTSVEYEMIGRFKTADFYDENLKTLALAYIDGIEIEMQSLKEKDGCQQLKYQEGHSKRFQTLKELTDQYGLLADNVDYKTNYYNKADFQVELYAAYQEIEEDLKQFGDNTELKFVDEITARLTIHNHTQYDYDIKFHFTFFDSEGTITRTDEIYYEGVRANTGYNIDFYFPREADRVDWYTEEYNIEKSSVAEEATELTTRN